MPEDFLVLFSLGVMSLAGKRNRKACDVLSLKLNMKWYSKREKSVKLPNKEKI